MISNADFVPVPVAPEIGKQNAKEGIGRKPKTNKINTRTWEHSLHTGGAAGSIPASPTTQSWQTRVISDAIG
jgi:hypothetical protein